MSLTVNTVPRYKGSQQLQNAAITDNGTTIALTRNTTVTGTVSPSDNVVMTTAAKGLVLKQGANGMCGTFVCNGISAVSVINTNIAITDCIVISLNTVGGTVGATPHVATITAATGFTTVGTASDSSTYNYCLIKNAA
jgi:hypothetical protein